jgi:hypothetical protein
VVASVDDRGQIREPVEVERLELLRDDLTTRVLHARKQLGHRPTRRDHVRRVRNAPSKVNNTRSLASRRPDHFA